MSLSSIAKYVSSLKQSCKRNSIYCIVRHTNINLEITKVLNRHDMIAHYFITYNDTPKKIIHKKKLKRMIVIFFKFRDHSNIISDIVLISKPGRHVYITHKNALYKYGKHIFSVLSTSKGFVSFSELRQLGLGGELLFEIYY